MTDLEALDRDLVTCHAQIVIGFTALALHLSRKNLRTDALPKCPVDGCNVGH